MPLWATVHKSSEVSSFNSSTRTGLTGYFFDFDLLAISKGIDFRRRQKRNKFFEARKDKLEKRDYPCYGERKAVRKVTVASFSHFPRGHHQSSESLLDEEIPIVRLVIEHQPTDKILPFYLG